MVRWTTEENTLLQGLSVKNLGMRKPSVTMFRRALIMKLVNIAKQAPLQWTVKDRKHSIKGRELMKQNSFRLCLVLLCLWSEMQNGKVESLLTGMIRKEDDIQSWCRMPKFQIEKSSHIVCS